MQSLLSLGGVRVNVLCQTQAESYFTLTHSHFTSLAHTHKYTKMATEIRLAALRSHLATSALVQPRPTPLIALGPRWPSFFALLIGLPVPLYATLCFLVGTEALRREIKNIVHILVCVLRQCLSVTPAVL